MQAQSALCGQPRVKKAAFADPRFFCRLISQGLSIFSPKFLGFFGEFIKIIDDRAAHSTLVATPPSSIVWKVRYLQISSFSEFRKFSNLRFLNFRKFSTLWISDFQILQNISNFDRINGKFQNIIIPNNPARCEIPIQTVCSVIFVQNKALKKSMIFDIFENFGLHVSGFSPDLRFHLVKPR